MSGGTACRFKEHRPKWEVVQYKSHHSAFSGGRYTPSEYSEVRCPVCPASWRTKAGYVDQLRTKGAP